MDVYQYLIFIKGVDRTDTVAAFRSEGGTCHIRFTNRDLEYSYRGENVWIQKAVGRINPVSVRIYHNNELLWGMRDIIDFDKQIRIFFENGRVQSYAKNALRIERNALEHENARDVLAYFRRIADLISLKAGDGTKLLVKQYEKLDFLEENTALADYFVPAAVVPGEVCSEKLIFPFGLNLSQMAAVENAFSPVRVSLIEGPPGTGKTQTILNIIANAILRDQTVAVVSNNNAATANVLEKLQKYGLSFFSASLGNSDNKEAFIEAQTGRYPDMREWSFTPEQAQTLWARAAVLRQELGERLAARNRIAQIHQELSDLACEQGHFERYYKASFSARYAKDVTGSPRAQSLLTIWLECERLAEKQGVLGWWAKIKNVLLYGVGNFRFFKRPLPEVIADLQHLYYPARYNELAAELTRLGQLLKGYGFEAKLMELTDISMSLFKAQLANRFSGGARTKFMVDDLWKNAAAVQHEYPVVLSTTQSIRSSLSKDTMFDYVIVDEASQADVVTGALALSCARRAVIVGDLMQLPNVVSDHLRDEAQSIWRQYQLPPDYNFSAHSLLSSASSVWTDAPRTMLREHYRCHPRIIGFCNRKFYAGELVVMTQDHAETDVLRVYKTVPGNHARGHVNLRQMAVIQEEVIPQLGSATTDIGVISPYRAQTEVMQDHIAEDGLAIDTVHKFQGREMDTIILATVDNEIGQFVDNPHLLNVAVSRAVSRLRVVIAAGEDKKNTNLADLVRYITYNNGDIVESQIRSIFDLLYKDYAVQRRIFLERHRTVSEFDSENLMQTVIDDVLRQPLFRTLGSAVHIPLRVLLRDASKLTPAERSFAMNGLTHVDFVLFNTMDKQPVLAIEVDGRFHRLPTQAARDQQKDAILARCGLPLLRLRTDGSRERERLTQTLEMVLGHT